MEKPSNGILIELSKELNITHEEEYELIYKPLDRFLGLVVFFFCLG